MLRNIRRWLFAISEEAAQQATRDIANDLLRLGQQLEANERENAARSGELATSLEELSRRISTIENSVSALAHRVDYEFSTTLSHAIRGLFVTGKGTIVNTSSEKITHVFDRLSDEALCGVAEAIATLAHLAPTSYSRFGDFEYSSDLAVHIRHSLWLNARRRGIDRPIIVPWHGNTKFALHFDNDLSHTLYASGYFEPNEFALLDRVLSSGMVFIDGGANEGLYTIFAAAKVGSEGHVVAVEPSQRELSRLRRNLDINQISNTNVVEAALAETSGSLDFRQAETKHSGQNTLGDFAYPGIKTDLISRVMATTVDEIVGSGGFERLDILKLDIEGAEMRALRGASGALREMKPMLLLEVSPNALRHQAGSVDELLALLTAQGYVVLKLDDGTGRLAPFTSADVSQSTNVVGVHQQRDWRLLSN